VCAGRWVGLRIPTATDLNEVRLLELAGDRFARYTHRASSAGVLTGGSVPALLQLVVCPLDEPAKVLATASCYAPDMRHRWAKLSFVGPLGDNDSARSGDGFVTFVSFLLAQYDFRKLYADVLGPNMRQFAALVERGPFREEGVLRGHEYLDGTYVDLHVLSVFRDAWFDYAEKVWRRNTEATNA